METGKTLTLYNVKVADGKMVLTERAGNKVAKGEGVLVRTDAADIVVTPLATTDLVPTEDNDLVATSVLPGDTVYAKKGRVLYSHEIRIFPSDTGWRTEKTVEGNSFQPFVCGILQKTLSLQGRRIVCACTCSTCADDSCCMERPRTDSARPSFITLAAM